MRRKMTLTEAGYNWFCCLKYLEELEQVIDECLLHSEDPREYIKDLESLHNTMNELGKVITFHLGEQ